ncbi:HDOD domain-containing protein [Motiliproteus coralliicola]|uniref:HDOD domain-containing protein n=1 Tax=Motiliproteus coralliicola TaxID=2283196 RepID=A0A369WUH9_9GAMM|nr:response regulator [Motiliproteus coralliicola]RDE24214.1 HDOD domain-containing protein [Motiliproteus coralliicola]
MAERQPISETPRRRVLFVDDDTNVLDGYRRLFRQQRDHWDMTFCDSGAQALEKLEAESFDVLVTDMQMPGMNGAELMSHAVNVAPGVARIVLTGYASMSSSVEATDLAHQLLNKPCDIDTLKEAIEHSCKVQSIITSDRVKQAIGRIGRLPSPPTVYHELSRALRQEDSDAATVTAIIEQDMAIAAKLLHLVNSAFFGLRRRVASLEQAVTLLGLRQIRDVVLATHVFGADLEASPGGELSLEKVRDHSVAVARLAREIMLEEGEGRELADQAFIGGLLHSFGILVLANTGFQKYDKAIDYCRRKGRTLPEVERVLFGATHAEAGAYILGLWKIPPVIVEAVLMHQTPGQLVSAKWSPVTAVHVANALVHEMRDGAKLYPVQPLDKTYLQQLGLLDRVERWRELAGLQFEELESPSS